MAEKTFNWQCPYCGQHQAVGSSRHSVEQVAILNDQSVLGATGLQVVSTVCANNACKQMELAVTQHRRQDAGGNHFNGFALKERIAKWPLLPKSSAQPLPGYIPEPIVEDYTEACQIRDLSPKASATLARRCLQGMIRDFCGITKKRLVDEIDTLKEAVESGKAPAGVQADTLDAIDHVRKIGNIGAHMESDINLIVEIDPDEAQTLIGLLEVLFKEWYIARHERQGRLKAIGVVAATKDAAKKTFP